MHKSKQNLNSWWNESLIRIIDGLYAPVSAVVNGLVLAQWGHVSVCRQTPSCRQFTYTAMRQKGAVMGLLMGINRMLHCRSIH